MNEAAFLSAIHEAPADDVAWLACADWLDDAGQSDRAELVRLTRRLRVLPTMEPTVERVSAEVRVAALLNAGVRPIVPEIVNDLGMRFALIPPGRFRMGSSAREQNGVETSRQVEDARAYYRERGLEETAHEVQLTRVVYLGVYPVTQRQYEVVTGINPSYFSRGGPGNAKVKDITDAELGDFPVDSVSWEDAQRFLKVLNAQSDAREKSWGYRLPTEAEWEYSCRGGGISSTPFHVGDSFSSYYANFNGNYPYGGAEKGPYLGRTCAVGSYGPNALGLYDMHGNVWEWCQDWHAPYAGGPETDPSGPPDGEYRVIRGGAFNYPGWFCRAAHRFGYSPQDQLASVSFRIALVPTK
jgi:uncharacterized protein (TIGR02996 family)